MINISIPKAHSFLCTGQNVKNGGANTVIQMATCKYNISKLTKIQSTGSNLGFVITILNKADIS